MLAHIIVSEYSVLVVGKEKWRLYFLVIRIKKENRGSLGKDVVRVRRQKAATRRLGGN